GSPPQGLLSRLRLALLKRQAQALDGAICTSHECMRQLLSLSGGRLPCSVERPQIVARYGSSSKPRARRLLYLGRIEENKGVFLLLEAFEALKDSHTHLSLDFAGTGSYQAALETRIRARDDDRVRYLGSLTSEGVHAVLADADLLVCPTMTTFNEGLALVGFEAAAHGVPSVLSSIVPAQDLLGDGCAVFEADSLEGLTSTLAVLIGNDAAFANLCAGLKPVTDQIYDRSASWGSRLCQAILQETLPRSVR
ncbi:MAG: glycosyltransferase family 4 protein, partial [Paracoccaceae bacterium]